MTPPVGAYAVVRTSGWAAQVIRYVTRSQFNHAIVYVGDDTIVEAQPKGACRSPLSTYPQAVWCVRDATDKRWNGQAIADYADTLVGTPYGWGDILSVGLLQYHIKPYFLRLIVKREDRLICSQLVDLANQLAGYHLFSDNRWPGDVTPGDLGLRIHLET